MILTPNKLVGMKGVNIMDNSITYEASSHSRWECKYHVVFVPKKRKKQLYEAVRRFLAKVFHELSRQRGSKIISGNMVQDHVHMLY